MAVPAEYRKHPPKRNPTYRGKPGREFKVSVGDLDRAIPRYLDACGENSEIPSIVGLAVHLGVTAQCLYQREDLRPYLQWVKTIKEDSLEQGMYRSSIPASAAVFALKQLGWRDSPQEHILSGGAQPIQVIERVIVSDARPPIDVQPDPPRLDISEAEDAQFHELPSQVVSRETLPESSGYAEHAATDPENPGGRGGGYPPDSGEVGAPGAGGRGVCVPEGPGGGGSRGAHPTDSSSQKLGDNESQPQREFRDPESQPQRDVDARQPSTDQFGVDPENGDDSNSGVISRNVVIPGTEDFLR